MYEPKFRYSDRLVSQLVKLEANKTRLLDVELSTPVKSKLALNSKTLDLFHLAHMYGIDITLKEAEKIATGIIPDDMDQSRLEILQNFRNVLEFNRSPMVDTYAEIDFAILLHLNKLVLVAWKDTNDAKFRGEFDEINPKADNWLEMRDKSVEGKDIQSLMIDLVEWYKDSIPVMTPLIRFGILIYRLMEIYPFFSGNILTIMAVADYLFLKTGLSSKSYTSVIRNFAVNEAKYVESVRMSRVNYDITYWLEALIESVNRDLIESREQLSEYMVEEEKSRKQPFLDLNQRQLKVLRYLQTVPYIKREDYCHMMDVSTMTAFRDLNDLVSKKLLKIEGQGRGTKYRLATM